MENLTTKTTFKLETFKDSFTGEVEHVISRIEIKDGKKYDSIEFTTEDLNEAKAKLKWLNVLYK